MVESTFLHDTEGEPVGVGRIYECAASLKQVLLAQGPGKFQGVAAMTEMQTKTLLSCESAIRANSKQRRRPCVVFSGRARIEQSRDARFVVLSTLEEFQPLFMCCNTQHFLRAVQSTPAWPDDDAYRLSITPTWPREQDRSTQHYVLSLPAGMNLIHHHDLLPCKYTKPDGSKDYYSVSRQELRRFEGVCLELREKYERLPAETLSRYNATYDTAHYLYSQLTRSKGLAKKERRAHFTSDELEELEDLFNIHVRATQLALAPEGSGGEEDVPTTRVQLTPYHVPFTFRRYFPGQQAADFNPPPFHADWPALAIPGGILSKQFVELACLVSNLRGEPTTESITHLLSEIIRVVRDSIAGYVHPGFAGADQTTLQSWVKRDGDLLRALESIHNAAASGMSTFGADVTGIRNYICMRL